MDTVRNGSAVVDPAADGSLVYTPDPGFVGTDTLDYSIVDNWGVSVTGTAAITVDAGCTITGDLPDPDRDGVLIVGTPGDDVICVRDRSDTNTLHIIDTGGGDDLILGGNGVNWIDTGPGRDIVYAYSGNDVIRSGPDTDEIYSGRGFDTIYSPDRSDVIVDSGGKVHGYELVIEHPPPQGPPVAVSDDAYVPVGATTQLHVLDNDSDPRRRPRRVHVGDHPNTHQRNRSGRGRS